MGGGYEGGAPGNEGERWVGLRRVDEGSKEGRKVLGMLGDSRAMESLNGFEPRDMFEEGRETIEGCEDLATQTFCLFGEFNRQCEVPAETQRRPSVG